MGELLESSNPHPRRATALPWLGLLMVAILSFAPLLLEQPPVDWVPSHDSTVAANIAKIGVILSMLAVIAFLVAATHQVDPANLLVALLCLFLAALMTAWHWYEIDRDSYLSNWQRGMYLDILNHTRDAPHQFRPLPYGFTRSLEAITGDWIFSCLAYRWFFTFWFVWLSYRLARLWLPVGRSLLTLIPIALLYPLSIAYYWGQLTDPLSHALFVLAMICTVQNRWALLAASLALGILAKETVVLMVPVYFVCWWRLGWPNVARTAVLGGVCVLAFLAARVPFGWTPTSEGMNGAGLMIRENLGLADWYGGAAPVYHNYLHPALFVGVFLPFLAWGWPRIDTRLKAIFLVLTPLLLLSNVCFGWMYESRNYMPLLPLLGTMTALALRPLSPPGSASPANLSR